MSSYVFMESSNLFLVEISQSGSYPCDFFCVTLCEQPLFPTHLDQSSLRRFHRPPFNTRDIPTGLHLKIRSCIKPRIATCHTLKNAKFNASICYITSITRWYLLLGFWIFRFPSLKLISFISVWDLIIKHKLLLGKSN